VKRFDRLEFETPEERPAPLGSASPAELRDDQYWLGVADQERRQGFFENALRYYSRALEINKALVTGWLGQVQMLVLLGEWKEAELWARKSLELFRKNADLTAGRAQALARLLQFKEAMQTSDASLAQEGQSAYRWIVRGEVMIASGQDVDPHCFSKAVQLAPDWLVALEIGQIYLFYRKPALALNYFRSATEKAPAEAYCWYTLGGCELELGLHNSAKSSFLRCLELRPDHPEARHRLLSMDSDRWSIRSALRRFFRRR
jgi:tetratricopeptide (TPR) repeat protein